MGLVVGGGRGWGVDGMWALHLGALGVTAGYYAAKQTPNLARKDEASIPLLLLSAPPLQLGERHVNLAPFERNRLRRK